MLLRLLCISSLCLTLLGCGSESHPPETNPEPKDPAYDRRTKTYNTPTAKLEPEEWPSIADDLDFEGMDLVIKRQLKRYKSKNLDGFIKLGGEKYPLKNVPKSLEKFRDLIAQYFRCQDEESKESCKALFTVDLKRNFNMFAPELTPDDPRYGEERQTLFTAYYTPLLRGRTEPDSRYKYAVYKNPRSKELLDKTRVDIDFKSALKSKNLEIFYADDLFDLYLLHVQGGGRILLEGRKGDLKSYYISYDGTNGQSWNFISHYMFDKGYITNKGIRAQREFLLANPQKQEEIYETCPSYVFFKKSNHPPLGNDNVSLTDNRSIATDTNYYKFKGLLSYVKARRPKEKRRKGIPYKDYSRFYLDQDTGGAIRGKARVDLYFGEGSYAELAAYNTKERGDLYFLMLK